MNTVTLCKKLLGVKDTAVESYDFYTDSNGVHHLRIYARANVWHQNVCPHCGRRHLPRYDRAARNPKVWRGLDFAGIVVQVVSETHRVICPEHDVVTAAVP